jgi:hypothetical protein
LFPIPCSNVSLSISTIAGIVGATPKARVEDPGGIVG